MDKEVARQVLANELGIDIASIKDSTTLGYDLMLDSLKYVKYLVQLENEFDVEFDDMKLVIDESITFGDFFDLLSEGIVS